MTHSNPNNLRADFDGGEMSSDFGALLVIGINRQTGLIPRLSAAISDQRHPSYTQQRVEDLLAQRIFQSACGYEDGNDTNSLCNDPVFKLALAKTQEEALASNPTFFLFRKASSQQTCYEWRTLLLMRLLTVQDMYSARG